MPKNAYDPVSIRRRGRMRPFSKNLMVACMKIPYFYGRLFFRHEGRNIIKNLCVIQPLDVRGIRVLFREVEKPLGCDYLGSRFCRERSRSKLFVTSTSSFTWAKASLQILSESGICRTSTFSRADKGKCAKSWKRAAILAL